MPVLHLYCCRQGTDTVLDDLNQNYSSSFILRPSYLFSLGESFYLFYVCFTNRVDEKLLMFYFQDSDLDSNTFDVESELSDSSMSSVSLMGSLPNAGPTSFLDSLMRIRSRIMAEESRSNDSTQNSECSENDAESITDTAHLKSFINNDQYDSIGSSVARELRNMTAEQSEIAQELISKVLNEGLLGRLTSNTVVCSPPSSVTPT